MFWGAGGDWLPSQAAWPWVPPLALALVLGSSPCQDLEAHSRGGILILWLSSSSQGESPALPFTPTQLPTSPSQTPGSWERPRNPHPTLGLRPRSRRHEIEKEKGRETERWGAGGAGGLAGREAGPQGRYKQRRRDAGRKRENWKDRNTKE